MEEQTKKTIETELFDFKILVETKIKYTIETLIENWSENTDFRIERK